MQVDLNTCLAFSFLQVVRVILVVPSLFLERRRQLHSENLHRLYSSGTESGRMRGIYLRLWEARNAHNTLFGKLQVMRVLQIPKYRAHLREQNINM
jgi:hypothetical protein